jgi:hypothetical protein
VCFSMALLISSTCQLRADSILPTAIAQSKSATVYSFLAAKALSKDEKRLYIKLAREKRVQAEQELDAQAFNKYDIMRIAAGTSGVLLTTYSALVAASSAICFYLNEESAKFEEYVFLLGAFFTACPLGYFSFSQLRKGVFSQTRKDKLMHALAIENMLYTAPSST